MNFYHTSGKDLYLAFEEIYAEYSVDCYEIEEGNRLKDLKMKVSEYTPDTARYILYKNMHLTPVSVIQCQSHLFRSKTRLSTVHYQASLALKQ
jgi:hypothetical protein